MCFGKFCDSTTAQPYTVAQHTKRAAGERGRFLPGILREKKLLPEITTRPTVPCARVFSSNITGYGRHPGKNAVLLIRDRSRHEIPANRVEGTCPPFPPSRTHNSGSTAYRVRGLSRPTGVDYLSHCDVKPASELNPGSPAPAQGTSSQGAYSSANVDGFSSFTSTPCYDRVP